MVPRHLRASIVPALASPLVQVATDASGALAILANRGTTIRFGERVTLDIPRESAPLRASHPTLIAAHRAVAASRDLMVARWIEWLGERITDTHAAPRDFVKDELRVLIDTFATLVGPLRREAKSVWNRAAELYGRHAAVRGLAAGEVVEEMQYLRELLIRHLAPEIAKLRPRQGMALLLRLNRLVDKGVAMAVVGYTDAMVNSLLPPPDGDGPRPLSSADDLHRSLAEVKAELARIAPSKAAR